MSEEQFQQQVTDLAQVLGYDMIYHNPDSRRMQAGFPDLTLISTSRGIVLFRELKTSKGRVRPDQVKCLAAMQAAGLNAGVWRPEDLHNKHIERDLRGQA
ncbi:hypothetical protein ASF72_10705 [Arthrobacter sp. Leaf141]|nr:hypothetical protein ASF72_10705 [Arthrobacter sp. Leaf141]